MNSRSLERSLSHWKPVAYFRLFKKNESAGPFILNNTGYGPAQLELSNVDLGEETVNQIIGQRGFEANLQTIKAADDMLGSLLDIKK